MKDLLFGIVCAFGLGLIIGYKFKPKEVDPMIRVGLPNSVALNNIYIEMCDTSAAITINAKKIQGYGKGVMVHGIGPKYIVPDTLKVLGISPRYLIPSIITPDTLRAIKLKGIAP